ncbi:uncharacterized protein LOC130625272 [Hydractinia symbiolongicarpus]|uniref:uncharacterized protein LOC130625272 n=1 Tax=Hydractinia symbiolongicarpus TaxID=13093 RepID=UPI00254FC912|nr:uncharacterized protein LOC130625272 [Hydractinia symbiolongicarpus]
MGDINIDCDDSSSTGFDSFTTFCETYNLKNLIKQKTCFTNTRASQIDVFLTNKHACFHNSKSFETGLSDHHHMISTFMKTFLVRLKSKEISYRCFKKFDEQVFLEEVRSTDFCCDNIDPNESYENLVLKFRNIIDKHAPIKIKLVRGNEAPFMNKKLRKAIYTRSRLKNNFNKNRTDQNRSKYKKQRNKCVSMRRQVIKEHFNSVMEGGIIQNKKFWSTVKPFLTNKSGKSSNEIMIVHDDIIVTDENELAEIFNEEYIHIVEKYSGVKPVSLRNYQSENRNEVISKILETYKNHPSILEIKNSLIDQNNDMLFNFKEVSNKRATVSPIDKGGKDKLCVNNYRPVSILNIFSKFYERIIKSQIVDYIDKKLSEFLSAYRESYGTQHVLIRLLEEWKQKLDKHYVVGAVLMDLSKAFDCVPHDLLIAKLNAYGFNQDALLLILAYHSDREQSTRINNQHNLIKLLECESNIALVWLKNNKMMANPKKFQSIIVTRDKCNNCDLVVKIGDKLIKTESEVKLLGVTIDNGLNFDSHISKLIKKTSAQLNSLFRLSTFLSHKAKLTLVQSFIYSNFNYCPLVWNFSSYKSLLRIEQIQKRALRFLLNDNDSTYDELLLKAGKYQMSVYRLKTLCTEIYKTMHELNPTYIKDIFKFHGSGRPVRSQNVNNLTVPNIDTVSFGTKSLSSLGPKIWNKLPNHLKSSESLSTFKNAIKSWNGIKCFCESVLISTTF